MKASLRGLDWLNFFLADVQSGVGPLLAIYLAARGWNEQTIAIQVLDGIGAAIFGVVSVLVIADLTRGSGRFNFTQGAVTTAVGIGAALSQSIAGGIVHACGNRAGFLFLSGVALAALAILYFFMPETHEHRNGRQC